MKICRQTVVSQSAIFLILSCNVSSSKSYSSWVLLFQILLDDRLTRPIIQTGAKMRLQPEYTFILTQRKEYFSSSPFMAVYTFYFKYLYVTMSHLPNISVSKRTYIFLFSTCCVYKYTQCILSIY